MKHKNIKLKAALTALGLSVAVAPANAIELEELIVTAQKRSESIQDVPISMLAITGATLAKTGAVDFESLSDSLPNVEINSAPGIKQILVRGLGSGPGSPSFEQSVGLYVDGVYASRIDLFAEPFMDVERVEVLKGPQGVLFGKNSIAGALAIHSAKPTDEFEGSVSANYDFEYDSYEVTGVLSGPVTENLSARVAVRKGSRGAFIDNGSTGPDGGEDDNTTIRGSLLWDAGENTQVYLKVEHSDIEVIGSTFEASADFTPGSFPFLLENVIPAGGLGGGFGDIVESVFRDSRAAGEDFIVNGQQFINSDTGVDQQTDNATLQVSHSIGEHELVYVGGYGAFDRNAIVDNDFSASDNLETDDTRDFTQTSHELRIVSPRGETIEYIAGLYYLDREFDRASTTNVFGPNPFFAVTAFQTYNEDSTSKAVFGQVTWNISDDFRASVGARYSEDDKTAINAEYGARSFRTTNLLANGSPFDQFRDGVLTSIFGPNLYLYERSIEEDSFDPSFNAQWDFNDDAMAYFSVTKATKSGGFDASESINQPDNFIYNEEQATGFELGVKMNFLDGRGRLNAAIFSTDFEDLQVSSFDPTANNGLGAYVTGNAGKASADGIEVDGLFAVSDKLTIGASVGYVKAEYDEFNAGCPDNALEAAKLNCVLIDGVIQQSLSGFQIENSPELSATMFAEYFTTLGGMNAGVRLDANYKDEVQLHNSQDSNLLEDAYTKVNLNFTLSSADDVWSLGLGVFNMTDETPRTFGGPQAFVPGLYYSGVTRGREIKATATYNF